MIGNDIIDRAASCRESNWQRKGWLQKLFSAYEQELISGAADPELMVWILWSMKESAYKIWNREQGRSSFAPTRLECRISGAVADKQVGGQVYFAQQVYYTGSTFNDHFIHTVAMRENNLAAAAVYIGGITERPGLPGYDYGKDTMGFPVLAEKATGRIRMASASDHGRFRAIACVL